MIDKLPAHNGFISDDEILYFFTWYPRGWFETSYHDLWITLCGTRGGTDVPIPSYRHFRSHWDEALDEGYARYKKIREPQVNAVGAPNARN